MLWHSDGERRSERKTMRTLGIKLAIAVSAILTLFAIGLNVNQKNFIDGLNNRATSLSNECGKEFDRKDIFCQIMSSLELLYQQVSKGDFTNVIREWKARTTIFGKGIKLTIADDVIQGVVLGLASDGGLVVETKSRQRVFYAGDVTLINEI